MGLRFELGDADAPRGHAILYARLSGGGERFVATYCVILPISFSIGKFLPPILGGQLPMEAMGDVSGIGAMPIPPMLEDIASYDELRTLAERRGDDLCDIGVLLITDDTQRLAFAAEAAAEYGRAYADYQARWPTEPVAPPISAGPAITELEASDVVTSLLPERDRLGELARLISQARYAIEVHDQRLLDEVSAQVRKLAATLPEKYRADQLADTALRTDAAGARLAELYLQRAYKLLDEDYIGIPPIEQRIRDLREQDTQGNPGGSPGSA